MKNTCIHAFMAPGGSSVGNSHPSASAARLAMSQTTCNSHRPLTLVVHFLGMDCRYLASNNVLQAINVVYVQPLYNVPHLQHVFHIQQTHRQVDSLCQADPLQPDSAQTFCGGTSDGVWLGLSLWWMISFKNCLSQVLSCIMRLVALNMLGKQRIWRCCTLQS